MQFKITWQSLTNVVRYFGCLRLLKKLPAIVWFGKLLPLLQKATAMCRHVQKLICFPTCRSVLHVLQADVDFARREVTVQVLKTWDGTLNFEWTHTHSYTFHHIFLIAFNSSNGFFQCDWLMSFAGRRIGLRTSWYVAYCFGIRGDAQLKSSSSIKAWFAMEHNSRRRTLPPPFSMIGSQLLLSIQYMHHYHVSNIYCTASSKQISEIFNETKHFMSIKNRQRPSFRSRWKDSICCSEQMIDEGNLLRFVQVRGTVVCHMLAPMSWPMSSWNHRMKGRAMSHPLRTWVARPALCCCQMPYFMDDPNRFSEAGQKHWPELMETHSETIRNLGIPTSRCDAKSGPEKKITVLRNPWHPFVKKLKKIWGGTLKIWTLKCKVVPQLMEITVTSLMEGSSPSTPCEERSWT